MSFRKIDFDIMLKGTVLAIVKIIFPQGIPSLEDFSRENGVAPSSFRRAAEWLLERLPALLQGRRPGPKNRPPDDREKRQEALRMLEDLRSWLYKERKPTEKNDCYSDEAKERIASLSEEVQSGGAMSFEEIAAHLGMDVRQLRRIRAAVAKGRREKSRRPKRIGELSGEIQELIARIQASGDSRRPYSPIDIKRILEKNYKAELLEHHGSETIALSTVSKYTMKERQEKKKKQAEHVRGSYRYPEPFQQVAIDTSHFKMFGFTFYLITVFEMAGRLNLITRVFLRENTAAVVSVIEEKLEKFPGVEVVVIDRGTPYLNVEVRELLESHGKLRIIAPSATPTAKAAAERHFKTLKEALRKAVAEVFGRHPQRSAGEIALMLEFGTAVFQVLYHQIPQENIDGKTPAERIESFDPKRACASMVDLFERSLNSQPATDYAREIHLRFQFPTSEKETVKRLKQFGTRALRRAVEEVASYMGPPYPEWMKDPLGFLALKAREMWEKQERAFLERKLACEKEKERKEEQKRKEEELDRESIEWQQHPERFVDRLLDQLLRCMRSNFQAGMKTVSLQLKDLLDSLSERLGNAFTHEVNRLRARISFMAEDARVREEANALLDSLIS